MTGFNRPNLLYNIDLSPDGNSLASTDSKNNILIYNAKQITPKTLSGHNDNVFKIKFSPNGSLIASASADKTVRLWSIDGKEINTLKHKGAVLDIIWVAT